jgi:CheY-like chemotaxis protein/anti-sigma regulatory factor (Ser/Thr protein kinase)
MVNDILDVAKIEAGKLQLAPGPVAVSSLCESSLRMIKQSAHKKHITVALHQDDQVETIWADGRRLKQILVNLLSNAVKFTPAGGQIGLEVKGDTRGKMVHLTVWDTGIGISPEDLERLFQPFVQLDSSLARHHTGAGLGLSLVRRLTALHSGQVTVESEPDQGSRFTVSLPWKTKDDYASALPAPSAQAPPHPEASLPPMPSSRSTPEAQSQAVILLAEDNQENIDTISEYLTFKGYQIIVARNGFEALALAQKSRPDLILMDIQMPEMDGLETIRRIRADTELAAVPIIALTALAMSGDQRRCLDAGANHYLSKPVRLARLTDVIAAQLRQSADRIS